MFKNNKIKKLLAFSVVSASFFLCGTSVSGAVKRSQSFGGFGSKKIQPSVRRSQSLGDFGGGNGGPLGKVKPLSYYEIPRGLSSTYTPIIIFSRGIPELVFEGTSVNGRKFRINRPTMDNVVYTYTGLKNMGENIKQYRRIIRE